MKIRISKEFSFEMAHALDGYDGLCRNIHGHSYKLIVTLIGEPETDATSPKLGMVMDFGDLKTIVHTSIIDQFDHAFAVKKGALANWRDCGNPKMFSRIIELDFQPTSENILLHFASILNPLIPAGVTLHSLRLSETVSSYAEWFSGDNF